jgi:hypothetical protein
LVDKGTSIFTSSGNPSDELLEATWRLAMKQRGERRILPSPLSFAEKRMVEKSHSMNFLKGELYGARS